MATVVISDEQILFYRQQGYLVVPNLLTEAEISQFLAFEDQDHGPSWRSNLRHHVDTPVWNHLATHPNVVHVAKQLAEGALRVVQTMYLEKAPAGKESVGGAGIALHQDLHYLPCEPASLMACWMALSDTDGENGGLCVVPGSHKKGMLETHRNADTDHDSWEIDYLMRDRDGKEWTERMYSFQISNLNESDILRLTVPQGAGVFFTGATVHGSYANRSMNRYRRAFATHYITEGSWMYRADVQDTMSATDRLS